MSSRKSGTSRAKNRTNSNPAQDAGDELLNLRASRDAAVRAAQEAVYNTTRLTRLLNILSEPARLDVLLDRVLATLSELFSADVVILLDPAGTGTFVPLAAIGLPEDMISRRFSDTEDSYVSTAMRSKAPVLITQADADALIDSQLHQLGIETAVWLPVLGSYDARGVLFLARCRPAPFVHSDVDLLTAMTYRIGLVLEQVQYGMQIEQIARTGQEIGRHLDEANVCDRAVEMLPSVVGADASALVLFEPDGSCSYVKQAGHEAGCKFNWCSLARMLLQDSKLANAEPFSVQDLRELKMPAIHSAHPDCPARAMLAIPVRIQEQTQGLFMAIRFSAIPFSPNTLQIAMLYTSQTAAALENARLYRKIRDELTERNRAEQALRARDERFSAMIRSVSDVIAILNQDGTVSYASPAAETVWGITSDELVGESILEHVHPDDCNTMSNLLSDVQEQPGLTLTNYLRIRQGSDNWRLFEVILTNLLHEPAVAGIVTTYHDITERKKYEQELTKLAYRDALTGLSNRAYFMTKMRYALEHADAADQRVAVLFFDLDNFKVVNDSLGHDKGDEVLQIVADRIQSCMRKEDTAARLGGDEFTILIEFVLNTDHITSIAHRIMSTLKSPIQLNDREIFVGCSMGIAISAPRQDSPEELLRKADLAMYEAKGMGKGCYAIFNPHMNVTVKERLELETELRRALQRKELQIYYQPILSLETHSMVELEALIRWQHPRRGLVMPAEIIPLAEETGLIVEIGQWVLEEACRQMRTWHEKYPEASSLSLSVNLSPRQFQNDGLINDINRAIRVSGLEPSRLILELTESSLFEDPKGIQERLQELKDIGVRIVIDDFGTGYASLSYLKQFPVDMLKIDRSFVQGMIRDTRDRAIVQTIIELAAAHGLGITGEGIETDEQAQQLRGLGCTRVQGFLFAPPLPPENLEAQFGK